LSAGRAALTSLTIYNAGFCCPGSQRYGLREIPVPLYDYQCAACNHQLEALQKISAAPLTDCPACEAPELKKQLSVPGFRLSGTGWYETDFKTGAKKNLAGGDKAD